MGVRSGFHGRKFFVRFYFYFLNRSYSLEDYFYNYGITLTIWTVAQWRFSWGFLPSSCHCARSVVPSRAFVCTRNTWCLLCDTLHSGPSKKIRLVANKLGPINHGSNTDLFYNKSIHNNTKYIFYNIIILPITKGSSFPEYSCRLTFQW